jgi:hypothetical protein
MIIISSLYILLLGKAIAIAFTLDENEWRCTNNNLWCHAAVPRGGSLREDETNDLHNFQSQSATSDEHRESTQQQQQQHQQHRTTSSSSKSLLPLIDTKTVALALRLTCETNRRLYRGTSGFVGRVDAETTTDAGEDDAANAAYSNVGSHVTNNDHHQHQNQQQYQHGQIVASSIPPAISSITEEERAEERRKEEMTIFHSKEPWKPSLKSSSYSSSSETDEIIRRGISRWGPNIDRYLDALLCSIGLAVHNDNDARGSDGESSSSSPETISSVLTATTTNRNNHRSPMEDERQLILSLTLLYLDHSISLDTPRHVDPHTGQPFYQCPHILPRTVHRLVLTAMIIATKSVKGESGEDFSTSLRKAANKLFGDEQVSEIDMDQMEQWMLHSLGADGSGALGQWQISAEEVQSFMRRWGETFYPQRLRAHDERNQSRMERLERFWREKAGVFGGVGGGQQQHHHHQQLSDHGHGHSHSSASDQYQHHHPHY